MICPSARVFNLVNKPVKLFLDDERGQKFKGQGIGNKQRNAKVTDSSKSFKCGCIFVNAPTGYIDVQFQSFFSAHETIDAVEQFVKQTQKIMGLSYQSINQMVDHVSHPTNFAIILLLRNNQIITLAPAFITKMGMQNVLSKPSWVWHKR